MRTDGAARRQKRNGGASLTGGCASSLHDGLSARKRFQRRFRDRHSPARAARAVRPRACFLAHRAIHSQTRPIPVNFESLPQGVGAAVQAAHEKTAAGILLLYLSAESPLPYHSATAA